MSESQRTIIEDRKHFEQLTADRKKAAEFAKFIRHMAMPKMETEEGQVFIDELDEPFHAIAKACEKWSESNA